jgi:acyl-ACP thioesterase
MQESAWSHAHSMNLGFEHMMEENQAWVLSRLALEIEKLPEWREELLLTTWARGFHRLFALRDFIIAGKATYIRATSSWLLIDLETRRPKKIEVVHGRMTLHEKESACGKNAEKVDPFPELQKQHERPVYYSDLDVNGHLNNVSYIRWIIDSLPADFFINHPVVSLTINFLNEALWTDRLEILFDRLPEAGNPLGVSVKRIDDGAEMCRALLTFSAPGLEPR